MLKIENLSLHYGSSQILHGISMQAELGKTTCIMGTNGVGKTSLLKAISGTHMRSSGDITFNAEKLGKLPAQAMAQLGVGYVPQGRDVFPLLTVREIWKPVTPACPVPNISSPAKFSNCSRFSRNFCTGAAAIFRAASNNNLPLPAP